MQNVDLLYPCLFSSEMPPTTRHVKTQDEPQRKTAEEGTEKIHAYDDDDTRRRQVLGNEDELTNHMPSTYLARQYPMLRWTNFGKKGQFADALHTVGQRRANGSIISMLRTNPDSERRKRRAEAS